MEVSPIESNYIVKTENLWEVFSFIFTYYNCIYLCLFQQDDYFLLEKKSLAEEIQNTIFSHQYLCLKDLRKQDLGGHSIETLERHCELVLTM